MVGAPDYAKQQQDFENENGKISSLMPVPLFEGDMGPGPQGPVPPGSRSDSFNIPETIRKSDLLDERSEKIASDVFSKLDVTPQSLVGLDQDQFVSKLQGAISSLVQQGMNPAVAQQMIMLIGQETETLRRGQTVDQESK